MTKVVLLKINGKEVTVTAAAYKASKDRYDALGAVPASVEEIIKREGGETEIKPPKKKKKSEGAIQPEH